MKNFERLNKNEMKMIVGGVNAQLEPGGGGCCSATCKNGDSILGTIELSEGGCAAAWDCRDFYPTADGAVCECF